MDRLISFGARFEMRERRRWPWVKRPLDLWLKIQSALTESRAAELKFVFCVEDIIPPSKTTLLCKTSTRKHVDTDVIIIEPFRDRCYLWTFNCFVISGVWPGQTSSFVGPSQTSSVVWPPQTSSAVWPPQTSSAVWPPHTSSAVWPPHSRPGRLQQLVLYSCGFSCEAKWVDLCGLPWRQNEWNPAGFHGDRMVAEWLYRLLAPFFLQRRTN